MVEKTTVRPDIRKLKIGDVLHVGTEDKDEIFKVTKLGENTYILDQGGELREYGRAVMAKNIYGFAEKYKAVYWVTHDEE
jgi:ABC-type lipoprotein release transport system permease subunit